MAEMLRLTSIEGGLNWWRTINWAAEAFWAAGFAVTLDRHGDDGMDNSRRVAENEADVSVSLASGAWMAANGRGAYRDRRLAVRGLALVMHPGHYFYNFVRRDLGIRSFAEIAAKKPKLGLSVGNKGYIAGQTTQAYLRHYGIELYRDIEAWGGTLYTSFAEATRLFIEGKANALMRENTRLTPAGVAASICDVVMLSMDQAIAEKLAAEFGTPVVEIPKGTLRGQDAPVLTVSNPGYPLVVGAHMTDELAYRLARAINDKSPQHYICEDIFYSPRHAPETGAPLHPGAAAYYRDIGVLAG